MLKRDRCDGGRPQDRLGAFVPRQGWREQIAAPRAAREAGTESAQADVQPRQEQREEEEEDKEEEEEVKAAAAAEADEWVGDTPWHCRVCDVAGSVSACSRSQPAPKAVVCSLSIPDPDAGHNAEL